MMQTSLLLPANGEKVQLPPHRLVVSPMVGASELAFRLLCRRYGAQLCYTPMLYAERFVTSLDYREHSFQTCAKDRPLVIQFCATCPTTLARAAQLVQNRCDAVDLNLGCPQREARTMGYGAYLLDADKHESVYAMVRTASAAVNVPIFCKIRILETVEATVSFAKGLQAAGCSLLVVHGRHRGNPEERRKGAADLSYIKAVKDAVGIPVISNGNTSTWQNVVDNLAVTGADGIMSAEGILHNPALFQPGILAPPLPDIAPPPPPASAPPPVDTLQLALEYLALAKVHGAPSSWAKRHVNKMCKPLMLRFQTWQLLDELQGPALSKALQQRQRKARQRQRKRARRRQKKQQQSAQQLSDQNAQIVTGRAEIKLEDGGELRNKEKQRGEEKKGDGEKDKDRDREEEDGGIEALEAIERVVLQTIMRRDAGYVYQRGGGGGRHCAGNVKRRRWVGRPASTAGAAATKRRKGSQDVEAAAALGAMEAAESTSQQVSSFEGW